MNNYQLLQQHEFLTHLKEDISTAKHIRLETLSLSPVLIPLFTAYLVEKKNLEILTNNPARNKWVWTDFIDTRIKLCSLGAKIFIWRSPYLHHQKIILIAPNIVYLGSHNLSWASLYSNIETSLRLEDDTLYQKLLDQFHKKTII